MSWEIQLMRDVIGRLIEILEKGSEAIVCQVVETRGSTPQKAGSMMIVDPDGRQGGTLGGGCVENEVKTKALQQLSSGTAAVHSFILDHDYAWADGLICGGRMVVIAQPVRGPEPLRYFRSVDKFLEEGTGFTEAIVLGNGSAADQPVGRRFLFDGEGISRACLPSGEIPDGLASRIPKPVARPKPSVHDGIAFLPSWPRIRLIVVGAGHVGQAVADLAAQADFDVWVVDDRVQYANRERFPRAQRIVVSPIDDVIPTLEITPRCYALIVTRGHGHDQEALFHLAPTEAAYVGLIGSRRKIRLIFDNLREAGIRDVDLDRVTAPVGLDIGSQTVPEIAISIVAELIARRNVGDRRPSSPRLSETAERVDAGVRCDAGGAT
jgi:xanthine dehydrogenase accessory factor